MDQEAVFEVETPGARIEVVAGQERVVAVDEQPLQVEGVVLVPPEMHVQRAGVDRSFVRLAEAAQVGFVQVRQRADRLERLLGRNVEVVGRLVAENDRDVAAGLDLLVDQPADRARQIEVRRKYDQLLLHLTKQLQYRRVQLVAAHAEAEQRRDADLARLDQVVRVVIAGLGEHAPELRDGGTQLNRLRYLSAVERMYRRTQDEGRVEQSGQAVGERSVVDQVVAVEAVTPVPLQVDVVETRAAVENVIVDDQALEVQHAHQFAPLHRYAVNRDAGAEAFGHAAIERRIALRLDLADQPALRAVPVDENRDFKLRLRLLGGVERGEYFAAGVVVLQVERGDQDALLRLRDQREDRFAVIDRALQRLHLAGRDR